jgi:hypothetical protein
MSIKEPDDREKLIADLKANNGCVALNVRDVLPKMAARELESYGTVTTRRDGNWIFVTLVQK